MKGLTVCLNDAVTRVKITKFPKPLLEKLDRLAREDGRSRSSLIRYLLVKKLEEQDDGRATG
jgi:metal-responsive CopG/Arc/MetJ family transcriptional regulator